MPEVKSVERIVSTCTLVFLSFCFIFPVFRGGIPLYSTLTDDFFYYLKIASNYKEGFGLSFTPGIFTNGYQPFYQALIIALVYLADFINTDEIVFAKITLAIVFLISSLLVQKKVNPSGFLQYLVFYLGILLYYLISYTGMESILIVPLLTFLLIDMARHSISFTRMVLMVTLCFFVRIDSIVLTGALACFHFISEKNYHSQLIKKSFTVTALFIMPVAVYLLINHFVYSSAFPISGVAKSVIRISGVHIEPFTSLYGYRPFNIFNIFTVIIAAVTLPRMNTEMRKYLIAFFAATILFYLQSAVRSDWRLWSWYFYPIPVISFMAATATGKLLVKNKRSSLLMLLSKRAALITMLPVLLGFMFVLLYTFPLRFLNPRFEGKIDILHIAGFNLKAFEENHKGVYAMGDRAGIAGYLMASPVIQLEGLVMDKEYLNNLHRSDKLLGLLRTYNVDYYIASNAEKISNGSYVVKEPIQSSGYSKKIIDTIDWKVAHQFKLVREGMLFRQSFEESETFIFEVPK